jgi:hypothetical protein
VGLDLAGEISMREIFPQQTQEEFPYERRDRDPSEPVDEPGRREPLDEPETPIPTDPVDEPEDNPTVDEPPERDPDPGEPAWQVN